MQVCHGPVKLAVLQDLKSSRRAFEHADQRVTSMFFALNMYLTEVPVSDWTVWASVPLAISTSHPDPGRHEATLQDMLGRMHESLQARGSSWASVDIIMSRAHQTLLCYCVATCVAHRPVESV